MLNSFTTALDLMRARRDRDHNLVGCEDRDDCVGARFVGDVASNQLKRSVDAISATETASTITCSTTNNADVGKRGRKSQPRVPKARGGASKLRSRSRRRMCAHRSCGAKKCDVWLMPPTLDPMKAVNSFCQTLGNYGYVRRGYGAIREESKIALAHYNLSRTSTTKDGQDLGWP